MGFIAFRKCPPHPQPRHCNPHLLISTLYLHSILHRCGAGLSVLWVAGSELREEFASTPNFCIAGTCCAKVGKAPCRRCPRDGLWGCESCVGWALGSTGTAVCSLGSVCLHPQCPLRALPTAAALPLALDFVKQTGSEQAPGHGAVPAERSLGIICALPLQGKFLAGSSCQCGRRELPPHGVGGFREMLLPQTL